MYARPPSSATSTLRPPEVFTAPSSSHLIAKREDPDAEPTEPILIDSRSPSPELRSTADSRQRLFASLEHGDYVLHDARPIETANDLDDIELKRCFDILHACGLATDASTTLASTSDTMEDFLNAVFNGWTGNDGEELIKPTMDFVVREHIIVGNICSKSSLIDNTHPNEANLFPIRPTT